MPFVFIIAGILFLMLSYNGTTGDFEKLLKNEFTGSQSFLVWASAIVILGLIGFFKPVRPITDAFIGLILLVIILQHSGLFAQFNSAIRAPVAPAPAPTGSVAPTGSPGFAGGAVPDILSGQH